MISSNLAVHLFKNFCLGSIPWLFIVEVFPSHARGIANSIGITILWTGCVLSTFTFLPITVSRLFYRSSLNGNLNFFHFRIFWAKIHFWCLQLHKFISLFFYGKECPKQKVKTQIQCLLVEK